MIHVQLLADGRLAYRVIRIEKAEKKPFSFYEKGFGAGDRGRTDTVSLPRDFESRTSANSITPAEKCDRIPAERY